MMTPRLTFCKRNTNLKTFVAYDSADSCAKGVALGSTVVGVATQLTDICDSKTAGK